MRDPTDGERSPGGAGSEGAPGAGGEAQGTGSGDAPGAGGQAPGGTGETYGDVGGTGRPGSTGPVQGPTPGTGAGGGSGLEPNLAGALSYLLGPITGIIFLVVDKDRPFIRFHAMQSIVVSVAWVAVWIVVTVLGTILNVIPILGTIIGILLWLALGILGLVLWLYLMWQAYQGHEWEIPVLGEQARKLGSSVNV